MTQSQESFDHLREQGYRLTPQRLAILHILRACGEHLTPAEIIARAQQELPGVTEATVYRTLGFLAEHELALAAHVGSGQLVYETGYRIDSLHQTFFGLCPACQAGESSAQNENSG
jgi:Fur family ferric uptake transcriptional regulator